MSLHWDNLTKSGPRGTFYVFKPFRISGQILSGWKTDVFLCPCCWCYKSALLLYWLWEMCEALHSSSNRTPEYEPRCFPAVCVGTHSAPLTAINCICTMCCTMEPQLELAEAVRAGHWAFLSAETAKSARGDSLRGLFVSMWGKRHTNGIGQTWSEASEHVFGYVLTSLLIQLFMSHQSSLHAIISQTLCSLNPEVYIYFMAAPPNELQKCDCYSHFWMNTLIRKTRIT